MRYLIFLFLLTSCYSQKEAGKQMDKAKINYPTLTAEKCAEWYPVKIIETKTDSTEYKEWVKVTDSIIDTIVKFDTIVNKDTIQKIIYKFKNLIKTIPPVHDTVKIIDLAKQNELQGKLKASETKLTDNYKLLNKVSLLALLLLLIILIITILKK